MLRLLTILCSVSATTAVFGQTITVWTNASALTPGGGNLGRSTNWNNGAPGSGYIAAFDGVVPGNLRVYSQDGINGNSSVPMGGAFGADGFSLDLTPNQTGSVSVFSPIPNSANMGFHALRVQAGAGQLILGDNTANQLQIVLRPSASPHQWINLSTNPVVINPTWLIQFGGGNTQHSIVFQGTGGFAITNNLRSNNGPNDPVPVIWDNTGTTVWAEGFPGGNGANNPTNRFNTLLGPVTISAGTLVITTPRLLPLNLTNGNTVTHNGMLLKFALSGIGGSSDTIPRVISGAGPIEVSSGTITLFGSNTTTGSFTLSGGEMIAGSAENPGVSGPLGIGGTISFTGGTLGFSSLNAFDYSPRFSAAAGQNYRINTAGQDVTFSNDLGSSGGNLTKFGPGRLTLAGISSYSGGTTNTAGTLMFAGSKTGMGSILSADGTTLGFTSTGTQATPGTLTLGTSGSATLEFNNVNSTTTPIVAANSLSAGGPIDINIGGGTFAVGQNYPLFSWTNGSTPAVNLGFVLGGTGTLNTNGNSIRLNVNALAYIWNGTNGVNWTGANNWRLGGSPATYSDPNPVLFDDTAAGGTDVTVVGVVQPTSVTVNNSSKAYSLSSTVGNNIGGSASLTKVGSGTLTLSGGHNTYTGVTTVRAGTVSLGTLANGGFASDLGAAGSSAANLVINGAALQYTGGAAGVDRLFTVGTGGGTIEASGSGSLNLNNSGMIGLAGLGARMLILAGSNTGDNTLTPVLGDSGGPTAVIKSGTGKWVLAGDNTYSGATTIASGVLQIGAGGATGSFGNGDVVNNGQILFNRTGTLTVKGIISGIGSVTKNDTGTVILENNNTYTSPTTINTGTLQIGDGGTTGSLYQNAPITNNALLIFNTAGTFTYNSPIIGTGNVIVRGGGLIKALGGFFDFESYTGWTLIEPGSTFQPCRGATGRLLSSVVTNNGTLLLMRQDKGVFFYSNNIVGSGRVLEDLSNDNPGDSTLLGTNTYTGGTWIAGGGIVLGDGVTAGAGSIVGNVIFTNSAPPGWGLYYPRLLTFNRPDNFIFAGDIESVVTDSSYTPNQGSLWQTGSGTVTLTGNNNYPGGTTINAGTLQVGNGGTTGSIGSGPVQNSGTLIFNRSGSLTVGPISGVGAVVQQGTGVTTVTNNNSVCMGFTCWTGNVFSGNTTISNGTLVLSGNLGGNVTLAGGNLAPGGLGSVGTLTNAGAFNWNLGNIMVTLNKSLVRSNSFISAGSITYTGGGLNLLNYGPALTVGDRFILFNQPIQNGGALTVTGAGVTWTNNLAMDGSISVLTAPPTLNFTQMGDSLQFSWTGDFKLQSQTNDITVGISTNWGDYPGGGSSPVTVPIDAANETVFFRLVSIP